MTGTWHDDDDMAALLAAVFDHYNLNYPAGRGNRKIHCPVHEDQHMSASVNASTGLWRCFACDHAGDAYTLVMLREGVGFVDAKRIVEGLVDGGVGHVRGQSAWNTSGLIPHRAGTGRRSRRYVPPWMRG